MASCGASCGVTRERERHRQLARQAALTRQESALEGFTAAELQRLARALGAALPCRVVTLGPGVEGPSWWLHLVATVAPTSWLERREGLKLQVPEGPETSLRVGLSAFGRFATLQEVRWLGLRDPDGLWIEARRAAGVEDRRLQTFVKATQGLLRREKITALDVAFLLEPSGSPEPPTLWQALFDPDLPETTVGCFLPEELSAANVCV
ncbi:MAG: hypothetical protein HY909_11805 [Deltaproteobacteria bacterium]|nr:hypothetical protein [Deltaproteobacteria bacterium]